MAAKIPCVFYSRLIDFTESVYEEVEEPVWRGYFYAVLMYLAAQLQSFVLAQYFKKMYVIGLHMRTGVISAVYRKVGFSCFVVTSPIFSPHLKRKKTPLVL